jgi:hypothetical protein
MSVLSEPVTINSVAVRNNTVHIGWALYVWNLAYVFRRIHGVDGPHAEEAAEKFLDQLTRQVQKTIQQNVDKVASKFEAATGKLSSQKPSEVLRVTATARRAKPSRRRVRKA